jgi:hypothetical protein
MTWMAERARVASLTRSRTPDDPDLVNARRNLKAIRLEDHVRSLISTPPYLTSFQRDSIANLLRVGGVE